jgi:D-cysteine desulfhydrase family pyridoxal phosphate-dependent enzyme
MNKQKRCVAIKNLEKFPRLALGFYPTPLEEMPRLREALGENCPRLFIKRDDFTGFGGGGNKIRKQEFLFAKLLDDGVEAVITTGGERSNHARMTAAVCAKLGLKCVLVLDRKPRPEGTENLIPAANFIEEMLGAEVHLVDSIEERRKKAAEIFENLRADGLKVYQIPLGGATALSTLGFVSAMKELAGQMRGFRFDHLFFSSSTAGTQAGMMIGAELFGLERLSIVGIAPEPAAGPEIKAEIIRLLKDAGELLEIEIDHLTSSAEVVDEYAGSGYCVETEKARRASDLLARTEGIILDPVYTAKAMAGLIERIETGRLNQKNNVLFWHTGGQLTQFYVPM